MIILVTRSSIEPSLFHSGCRPNLHVGLHLLHHFYLTMEWTHPRTMWERPAQHLHLTMGGTQTPPCQKGTPNTHIWPWEEHIHHHVRKAQHSHPTMGGTHLRTMSERHAQHSHLTMGGTHPKPMSERPNTRIWPCEKHTASEWLCTYIWPCENTSH